MILQLWHLSYQTTMCQSVQRAIDFSLTLNHRPGLLRRYFRHGACRVSDKMVHTIFLARQPVAGGFEALRQAHRDRGAERLALGDRVLYLDYVHGVGVSDLTGRFIEKRLGCRGTARNMTSLKRILAKMEDFAGWLATSPLPSSNRSAS